MQTGASWYRERLRGRTRDSALLSPYVNNYTVASNGCWHLLLFMLHFISKALLPSYSSFHLRDLDLYCISLAGKLASPPATALLSLLFLCELVTRSEPWRQISKLPICYIRIIINITAGSNFKTEWIFINITKKVILDQTFCLCSQLVVLDSL